MKLDLTKSSAITKALKDAPVQKPIDLSDTAIKGLTARVRKMPEGHVAGSWSLRVMVDGKSRRISLGDVNEMTPAQARIAAMEVREAARQGVAVQSRRVEAQAARQEASIAEAKTEKASISLHTLLFDNSDKDRKSYYATHWDKLKGGSEYARRVEMLMGDDIHRPIAELTPQIMEQIFLRKVDSAPHAAQRSVAYLRPALIHFHKRGYCRHDLLGLVDDHRVDVVQRDRVLNSDEWRSVWLATGTELLNITPAGLAIRTLMLTGARNREVCEMRESELHLAEAEWHIPKDRSKNSQPHVFVLPPRAVEIIQHAINTKATFGIDSPYVFSNDGRSPVQLGTRIKRQTDSRSGVENWVFHDLRRSFATHLAEAGVGSETVDLMLNHKASASRGMIAAIYNRSQLLAQRHSAAVKWGQITDRWIDGETSNVVKIA
jgi:integrase